MKTMTCKQLGGACDIAFQANTFEDIAEKSKKHGMEMYEAGDQNHIAAMEQMKEKMKDPQAMKQWMDEKRIEFEELHEDN